MSEEISAAEYLDNPLGKGSRPHQAYVGGFLAMRPAPEYASGEVLLASTYRGVGFDGVASEGKVPKQGRELERRIGKEIRKSKDRGLVTESGMDADTWRSILTSTLRSPKQPNQSSKRFLQICPLVPDACLYSLAARQSGNPWNPGALVANALFLGAESAEEAGRVWDRLYEALSVTKDDDPWARFLDGEFAQWRVDDENSRGWHRPEGFRREWDADAFRASPPNSYPARRFVQDVERIIELKTQLTRRQWTSLLEALIRLGTTSHVLWLCQANHICSQLMMDVADGQVSPPSVDEVSGLLSTPEGGFWRYGQLAAGPISDLPTRYIRARAGISLFLWQFSEQVGQDGLEDCLSSVESLSQFLVRIADSRVSFDRAEFHDRLFEMYERDPRVFAAKRGIGSNIREFIRHALGKRETSEPGLDSYDQGYFLSRRGAYRTAPWMVSMGPASTLAIVHCCTALSSLPATVEDLCRHLGSYGISVSPGDVPHSMLGTTLRHLGLVLDSPDAEGGMVVLNPFDSGREGEAS